MTGSDHDARKSFLFQPFVRILHPFHISQSLFRSSPSNRLIIVLRYRRDERITLLAEAANASAAVPGSKYAIIDQSVFKRRSESIKFDTGKTGRLDPIKRTE